MFFLGLLEFLSAVFCSFKCVSPVPPWLNLFLCFLSDTIVNGILNFLFGLLIAAGFRVPPKFIF